MSDERKVSLLSAIYLPLFFFEFVNPFDYELLCNCRSDTRSSHSIDIGVECGNAHIVHTVNVGTNNDPVREKRKMEVPMADKPNAELNLRTVEEFHDVASAGRLNLSTGPLKFAKFRESATSATGSSTANMGCSSKLLG